MYEKCNRVARTSRRDEQALQKGPEVRQRLLLYLLRGQRLAFDRLQIARQIGRERCLQLVPIADRLASRVVRAEVVAEFNCVGGLDVEMRQQTLRESKRESVSKCECESKRVSDSIDISGAMQVKRLFMANIIFDSQHSTEDTVCAAESHFAPGHVYKQN